MKKVTNPVLADVKATSVQEKILQDRQTYTQEKKVEGPVIDLFYQELRDQSPKIRRFLDLLFGSLLYLVYLLLNPFIYTYLKLSGIKSPYREFTGIGQFGNPLKVKIYNIGYFQSVDDAPFDKGTPPVHFLFKTNLYKLPLTPEVLKGNISLVGPQILEESFAMDLINKYTDFHKRFAPKPGVYTPSCYYRFENINEDFENELEKDLRYSSKQTIKTYLDAL